VSGAVAGTSTTTPSAVALNFNLSPPASSRAERHGVFQAGHDEFFIGGPVEHMQVKGGFVAGHFCGATAPGQPLEGAGGGGVNRVVIDFHPCADGLEPLDAGFGDEALAGRPDVEQIISALAGDVHEVADDGPRGFPVIIVTLEAPGVVHGHAGFPIASGKTRGGE